MRRALRWAGNGLATLSLLPCAAALVAWPVSYGHGGQRSATHWPVADGGRAARGAAAEVGYGSFSLYVFHTRSPTPLWGRRDGGLQWEGDATQPYHPGALAAFGVPSWRGFAAGASSFGARPAGTLVTLAGADAPLWARALAFALLPAGGHTGGSSGGGWPAPAPRLRCSFQRPAGDERRGSPKVPLLPRPARGRMPGRWPAARPPRPSR